MNKKKIIILAVLFVAVAGFTLAPASSATWKKFDSGKIKVSEATSGLKNYMTYVTYSKGNNNI